MENWLMMVMSVCIGAVVVVVVRFLVSISISSHKNNNNNKNLLLPPGPPSFPIITNISWLRKSTTEIESILRNLHRKYGPLVTLWITHRPAIFVADRSIAHQALVQNGAVFADRPPALLTSRILSHNQHNISSASYGPTWRLLRRNLTSEILHPSRLKSYSNARSWVLHLLLDRLSISINNSPTPATDNCVIITKVKEHLQYAMFCLLVLMCFGDKLDEPKIKDIETVQRRLLLRLRRFNILNFWPNITKILLRSRWKEFLQLLQDQESVLIPLIEARRKIRSSLVQDEDELIVCYVDTLLDLRLQEKDEKERELEMGEIVSLCSEFLNAGTDTTSTALEWIMANMVKHPHIQDKLYEEMKEIMIHQDKARASAKQLDDANDHVMIEEEDLQKMPYLKAVILEGLRRHPPGHFVLPHAVTEEEVVLGGHVVPKNATINFMVAEMGWDPNVWVDPMAFKPERFLSPSQVDITGSKEIKMMPFGAGRRICPGYGLAILHLEYFVANLVWRFQWKPVDGDEVDLSEKQEFTTVMKYPLKARLFPRSHSS